MAKIGGKSAWKEEREQLNERTSTKEVLLSASISDEVLKDGSTAGAVTKEEVREWRKKKRRKRNTPFSHDGDLARVSAECRNVFLDPRHRQTLVEDPEVLNSVAMSFVPGRKAGDEEAIVQAGEDLQQASEFKRDQRRYMSEGGERKKGGRERTHDGCTHLNTLLDDVTAVAASDGGRASVETSSVDPENDGKGVTGRNERRTDDVDGKAIFRLVERRRSSVSGAIANGRVVGGVEAVVGEGDGARERVLEAPGRVGIRQPSEEMLRKGRQYDPWRREGAEESKRTSTTLHREGAGKGRTVHRPVLNFDDGGGGERRRGKRERDREGAVGRAGSHESAGEPHHGLAGVDVVD
jgi:hypothetical protein